MTIQIELVISPQFASVPDDVLRNMLDPLRRLRLVEEEYIYDGVREPFERAASEIKRERRYGFNLVGENTRLSMSSSGQFRIDMAKVRVPDTIGVDGIELICKSLMRCDGAQFSAAVNEAYLKWQNEKDPDAFEEQQGLHLVSNGLPPPLDAKIVDTSNNPGRKVLRSGTIEMVGGMMWLSDEFFEATGASRSALEQLPYLQLDETDGILRVVLDENLLADAEGDEEMAKKQDELRAVLYPQTEVEPMT